MIYAPFYTALAVGHNRQLLMEIVGRDVRQGIAATARRAVNDDFRASGMPVYMPVVDAQSFPRVRHLSQASNQAAKRQRNAGSQIAAKDFRRVSHYVT